MMNDGHGRWKGRLSEYVDGGLGRDERDAFEAHLGECGLCRAALEEVRALVEEARNLPNLEPPRDLWPGIAAAIRAPIEGNRETHGQIIPLPVESRAERTRSDSVTLTRPQLAAAAVILILVSAAATSWAGPGVAVRQDAAVSPVAGAVRAVADGMAPSPDLAAEVEALEAMLAAAAGTLDPKTVRILSRNLEVIERAIEDSKHALATDPANPFLTEHLDRAYQRKLSYLREVAQITEWAG